MSTNWPQFAPTVDAARHPHPRSSWRYLESKTEYPWAGGPFVYVEHVSYFLCEECGAVLRIVAAPNP